MKKIMLLMLATFSLTVGHAQMEVSGVSLPKTETIGEHELTLNGAGVREKLWIDLYVGALYLAEPSADAQAIVSGDDAMMVKLHIVSKLISSSKMISAVEEGFENSTDGNTSPIKGKIDRFISFFKEEIKKNDVFDIMYQPDRGVVAYKNGEEKGVIKGMEFKKALFGIWLSNRPADDDLKEAMLGKD